MDEKCLLIARVPKISDGAKITLIEMAFHPEDTQPSIGRLAKIRNIARSTIHLHLSELKSSGLIKASRMSGQQVIYRIDYGKLESVTGFSKKSSKQFIDIATTGQPAEEVTSVTKDFSKMKSKDLLMYFKSKYREVIDGNYAFHSKDYVRMKNLHRDYGAEKVLASIEYFSHNWRKMGMPNFSIEHLFDAKNRIFGKLDKGKL